MPSAKSLISRMNSAHVNYDLSDARQALLDWQASNCYHPQKVRVYDAHIATTRTVFVPCGRCYHCIETKINQWVTRMYAHCEEFKHVYFVTLTYRSITNIQNAASRLILEKLKSAVWHLDDLNQFHHLSYNPCLLCKEHYQNFLKRLRANTGNNDITYVLSGEMGKRFGRPHFHLILFSKTPISRDDVVRAWSVSLFHKNSGELVYRRNQKYDGIAYDFPIGRVDFHDLVTNGSFNTKAKIKVDGHYMNASNCFAYVAKYVIKNERVNFCRVNLAYNSLFERNTYTKIFDNEVILDKVKDWLQEHGYPAYAINDIITKQKLLSYEKIDSKKCDLVFPFDVNQTKEVQKRLYVEVCRLYPETIADFRTKFAPFCEFSRGTPIGSVYAKNHIHEFVEGVFNKPLLQMSGYVLPSYFVNKAQEHVYGLRRLSATISSESFSLSPLPNLYRYFQNFLETGVLPPFCYPSIPDAEKLQQVLRSPLYCFKDLSTGERIYLTSNAAVCHKYNRKERKYLCTRRVPIADWIRLQCAKLEAAYKAHLQKIEVSKENLRSADASVLMATDLGIDTDALKKSFLQNQNEYLRNKQNIYDSIHASAE